MNTRLIVVDGNPLLYRSYHSPGTRNLKTSKGLMSGGFYGFLRSYLTLKKRFHHSPFIFCFDSGRSWRNDIFPGYKTHAEDPKPNGFLRQLEHAKDFLTLIGVPVYCVPMLEADDLISVFTCAWSRLLLKHTVIIVSSDRDFFQLINDSIMVYDDRAKKFYGPTEVNESIGIDCKYFLYYKCLIGDVSDKIPGVIGFGPVKAKKLCNLQADINFSLQLSERDIAVFQRNMELIRLPRSVKDLKSTNQIQYYLREEIDSLDDLKKVTYNSDVALLKKAQELLDIYECKSFTVETFING